MKKWVLILLLVLSGCTNQKKEPVLHIFYSKTCSDCLLLEEKFIPLLEGINVEVHDIDKIESVELYKDYLDTLVNIDKSLYDTPMTPFIYMDDGFGAVGYSVIMNDVYLDLIQETIDNEEYTIVPSGVWICEEE